MQFANIQMKLHSVLLNFKRTKFRLCVFEPCVKIYKYELIKCAMLT